MVLSLTEMCTFAHLFFLVGIASGSLRLAYAEMFTAIVELERILHTENEIVKDLRSYIQQEEMRIDQLKRMADDFEQHSMHALANPEKHLSNPVNAFLVVKRFTSDWDYIVDTYIRSNATEAFIERLTSQSDQFPSQEDLTGAAVALLRLQDTYALSTTHLAQGNLLGVTGSSVMTAADCFELGRLAYNEADYYHTALWMQEALNRLETDHQLPVYISSQELQPAVILDYLAYAVYMQGNIREALQLTDQLLKLDPYNTRAHNNKQYYEQLISSDTQSDSLQSSAEDDLRRPLDGYRNNEEFVTYERLCRGERTHDYKDDQELSCQYRRHHPLFFIRPLKEEIVYVKPRVAIYHDFLSEHDMATIKTLATPRLNRATVQNAVTGKLETASYRVSKSAWLRDEEDVRIARISESASALLNLTLDTVEELQVVNYGIGGHYEPHYDFARKREKNAFESWRGNRVATFICYISEVDAGGATVFPEIGLRLVPEKGACAVWYNLMLSGDGDYDTRHAACPVLAGSKWVCNKWFHERGQEFIRRCSVSPNE